MENMTTPAVYHDAGAKDEEYDWDRFFKSVDIMSATIYSLVCVIGVLGNGMVIWVLGFRMRKDVTTVLFLNLAVADFLATAFLPLNITQRALDNQWPFGWFMCKMDSVVFYMNMYASIYILVLISVDRCVGVVWQGVWNHRFHTVRNASLASLGVWVMALALSIPHVISKELDFGFCGDYPDPPLVITNLLVGFAFPFSVIVSCYSVFIYRIRGDGSRRPITIIATIIAAFFLCWAPFHIIRLIYVVVTKISKTLGLVLEFGVPISLTLALLNSCLNPLLYVFTGGRLRRVCRESILKVLEKAFAEHQPNNAPTDVELKDVFLVI